MPWTRVYFRTFTLLDLVYSFSFGLFIWILLDFLYALCFVGLRRNLIGLCNNDHMTKSRVVT